MPSTPIPVVLATLALRRRLKQLADRMVPPQIAMLDVGEGVGGVQVAAAIAELGIADVLAAGPMTAAQVAARVDCDEDTTLRLLRGAVAGGLCTMNRRTGAVKLTRMGAVLRSDHPASLRAWMRYKGMRSTMDAWGGLAESVRTGRSAFEIVHGMSVWEWYAAHPEEEHVFASTMRQATEISARAIARVYPWPDGAVVCDVAGGIGTLLSAVVRETAHLRGVLVDSAAMTAVARPFLADRGVADRIDVVDGDIFGVIDVTADVYTIKDVLHDWDDERCRKILGAVAASMPSGSKLVVIEYLQPRHRPNPYSPLLDLHTLTQRDGGRLRSRAELSALLTDVGLRPTGRTFSVVPHDLLEAEKV
ncbi:methyltransferase [Mycolicibacterium duvalii]|uniref:Methyltransferase n=1 Tax=Mycolicibacterium duvalii TaxID=39688 RepID=A0A7I7K5U2_9MYCO|nr:methyltransferase [Mycolicibacterium duvalii]MCV7366021.1 methyltransferase [Mycolicibacterium duvalii]PEG40134.1 methyltransferase [Mycolicibacterium duvalii]BBX19466.1 methyltransferase [Mycolicibacterium duvalii]